MIIFRRAVIFAIAALFIPYSAHAQYTLSTIATLNGTHGGDLYGGLIADASGNLYSTAYDNAAGNGSVFEVAAGTHLVSTLVAFNGANGSHPRGSLLADASGNLYSTSYDGGASGDGTVFELAAGTHAISTLVTFNGANGQNPFSGLISDANGNLYGTTANGGANNDGLLFEVAAGSHTLSTLATFNGANGSFPIGCLCADASGNLYGTTFSGGANGKGTVFEVSAGSHMLSTLATFNGANGGFPFAGLIVDANGNLYGTTRAGGAIGDGIVFEVAAGTDALSTLATFNFTNGENPNSPLTLVGGNLFGTTTEGGANLFDGTVFMVSIGTHALTTVATFNGDNGDNPFSSTGLLADGSGNLYGTTNSGGLNGGLGVVYELSPVPEPGTFALGLWLPILGAFFLWTRRRPLDSRVPRILRQRRESLADTAS